MSEIILGAIILVSLAMVITFVVLLKVNLYKQSRKYYIFSRTSEEKEPTKLNDPERKTAYPFYFWNLSEEGQTKRAPQYMIFGGRSNGKTWLFEQMQELNRQKQEKGFMTTNFPAFCEQAEPTEKEKSKMNEVKIDLDKLSEEDKALVTQLVRKNENKGKYDFKDGDIIYFTDRMGRAVSVSYDHGSESMNGLKRLNKLFLSSGECIFDFNKDIVCAELERYAKEHNEEPIDWENGDQIKFYFVYSNHLKTLIFDWNRHNISSGCHYFTSKKIAKEAVQFIGEERIVKYLFTDYK